MKCDRCSGKMKQFARIGYDAVYKCVACDYQKAVYKPERSLKSILKKKVW